MQSTRNVEGVTARMSLHQEMYQTTFLYLLQVSEYTVLHIFSHFHIGENHTDVGFGEEILFESEHVYETPLYRLFLPFVIVIRRVDSRRVVVVGAHEAKSRPANFTGKLGSVLGIDDGSGV